VSETEFFHEIRPDQLNLFACLFCGQSFGWDALGQNEFQGWFVFEGQTHTAHLKQTPKGVFVRTSAPRSWFFRYFNLGLDLNQIISTFPNDPDIALALRRFKGLRVLAQDPWETLVSFIISQNNNIARIRLILRRMMRAFGGFPRPEDLLDTPLLKTIGLGYRAEYLTNLGRAVASGRFNPEELRDMSDRDAMRCLLSLHGVGPKVASCVLLYGYGRHGAFPVDVWLKRMAKPIDYGPYAGWAQLYLYALARGLDHL